MGGKAVKAHGRVGTGLLLALLLLGGGSPRAEVAVQAIGWSETPHPRLLVDFSAEPEYRISRTATQLRIEIADASPHLRLVQPPAAHPAASHIGSLPGKSAHSLDLLIELKTAAVPKFRREIRADGVRLVVQWPDGLTAGGRKMGSKPAPDRGLEGGVGKRGPSAPVVIAIDAGHGGQDTGAIGPSGVREKDVVLAIARRLAALVRAEKGMRAVMVRGGDHFVDLRRRARIARLARAELFVSIHADAFENTQARGSGVFTLSETGASSEAARCLADRENQAVSLAGVKLKGRNPVLASVLVDLSKNATLEASDLAANKVLAELKKHFPVHNPTVQKAGFAVLKSLDVPSLLVETAFISNPAEERNLTKPRHQEQLARAVFQGIRAYFAEIRRDGSAFSIAKVP